MVNPKKKKPIIVNNPNHPRLKAYQDSLNAYNKEKTFYEKETKMNYDELFNFVKNPNPSKPIGYTFSGKPLYAHKKPKQPVEFKEDNIAPLVPKKAKLSIQEPTDTLKKVSTVNTNTSSEPKEKVIKKSPFAQYPNMKKKIEKFNNSQSFVSGAKSVKQYRGDENLPEAKNGMKKCGCKHTRSKYKYQEGTENLDLEVDNDPEIIELNRKIKEFDDRMSGKSKPKPAEKKTSVIENKPVAKIQAPVVAKTKIAIPVTKTVKTVQENKVKPVKRTVIRNYAKAKKETQVSQDSTKHSGLVAYHKYKDFQTQAEKMSKDSTLSEDIRNKNIFNINRSQMEYLRDLQGKDKEFVENALRGPQQNEERQKLKKETETYQQELQKRRNKTSFEKSADVKRYEAERKEKENNPSFLDTVKYAFTGKYKYGSGALPIPENSAIVTANDGKNKLALEAYADKDWKRLNSIIEDMPEDNVDKAQDGKEKVLTRAEREARYKRLKLLTGPLSPQEQDNIKEDEKELTKDSFAPYTSPVEDAWKGEDKDNKKYRERLQTDPEYRAAEIKAGRAYKDKNGNFNYKYAGNSYKKNQPNNDEIAGKFTTNTLPDIKMSDEDSKALKKSPPSSSSIPDDKKDDSFASNKRGGNFLANIPSLAEIAAKSSLLAQGVEGVPENYLKLGRYNYASQLPKTLREIQLAEQGGRESARDIVGGDAGRYLAQSGALSSARMKASNEAVIQDTLARQDILNKNVDKGDEENKINTGLKNQYATQRSANRGAYNNMLVSLGQSIDTATDASKLMASQKESDDVRTNLLKTGNYHMDKEGNVHMNKTKKGAKKLKTYKRK